MNITEGPNCETKGPIAIKLIDTSSDKPRVTASIIAPITETAIAVGVTLTGRTVDTTWADASAAIDVLLLTVLESVITGGCRTEVITATDSVHAIAVLLTPLVLAARITIRATTVLIRLSTIMGKVIAGRCLAVSALTHVGATVSTTQAIQPISAGVTDRPTAIHIGLILVLDAIATIRCELIHRQLAGVTGSISIIGTGWAPVAISPIQSAGNADTHGEVELTQLVRCLECSRVGVAIIVVAAPVVVPSDRCSVRPIPVLIAIGIRVVRAIAHLYPNARMIVVAGALIGDAFLAKDTGYEDIRLTADGERERLIDTTEVHLLTAASVLATAGVAIIVLVT